MRHAWHSSPVRSAVRRRLLGAVLAAAALSAGAAAVATLVAVDSSRTAEGSTVGGVPASALTQDEVRALVKDRVARAPRSVSITLGSRTSTLTVVDLGIRIDEEATAHEALATSAQRRRFGVLGLVPGKAVRPQLVTDDKQLQRVTARLLRESTVIESHGSLGISAGRVSSQPPRPGQSTTASAITQVLETYVASLVRADRVNVPTTTSPAHVTLGDVQALVERAQAHVERATVLASGSRTTSIPGALLMDHLTIVGLGSAAGHPIALGLDRSGTTGLAQGIADALSTPAVEPTIQAPAPLPVLTAQGSVTWRPRLVATGVTAGASAGQEVSAQVVRETLLADLRCVLDGKLSTDIGGGVSQFATTTLNAAFFAGLRLDRHQAHSFYISRYPAGREATVNYLGIDLRWTNTTAAPVLVRASTGPTSLTVALYGQGDGRIVDAVSGPRRPLPGRDFQITVSRIVRVPGQPVRRDSYTTFYDKAPKDD
jgi:hypothetical protein